MKNYKKILAMILGTVMTVSMLAGCGGSDSSQTQAPAETVKETAADAAESTAQTAEAEAGYTERRGNTEFSGTLKLYGPGLSHNSWGGRKHGYQLPVFPSPAIMW